MTIAKKSALYLHIGSGKAGSTTIQAFLDENREELKNAGYLVPVTAGPARHVNLLNLTHPEDVVEKHQIANGIPAHERISGRERFVEAFEADLTGSACRRVILSEESMALRYTEEQVAGVSRYLHELAETITVICYLRRQDLHLLSNYQEQVRAYYAGSFEEFSQASDFYDYHSRMLMWSRYFERDELLIVPFERDQFHRRDLIADFTQHLGVPAELAPTSESRTLNSGLDAFQLEYLARVNARYLTGREADDFGELMRIRQGVLDYRPAEYVKPALSREDSEAILALYAESNARLAAEFLGRPDRVLFREQLSDPQFPFGSEPTFRRAAELFAVL